MIVIKFGGHAMTDDQVSVAPWANAIKRALANGEKFVIVHGGGPQIDLAIAAAGLESTFVGGYRVTTPEVFKIVESVLTGTVLRGLVRKFLTAGLDVVGVTGSDGNLLEVVEKKVIDNGISKSIGQVGEVVGVNLNLLNSLLSAGLIPMVSPVSTSADGTGMNINADIAAGAIAGALKADQVIFLTDVPGIYSKWPDKSSLIAEISAHELAKVSDTFKAGMAPKVTACLNALSLGARSARVIDGTDPETFQAALQGRGGTLVTP